MPLNGGIISSRFRAVFCRRLLTVRERIKEDTRSYAQKCALHPTIRVDRSLSKGFPRNCLHRTLQRGTVMEGFRFALIKSEAACLPCLLLKLMLTKSFFRKHTEGSMSIGDLK
ncbi:hypothetical protein CDAR_254731 [Caerostris darwini]|uniref:Uncharacterized protein n=1 Tax=Caerostris darwini TaxID=1538125 RepID=A0AAV4N3Z4_9ARAC|nr:hypothetical protein CDAR_254731 [Caerostris darwini]